MEERRKAPRIQEENEVTITVISDINNFPKEKIINNFTKDLSAGGAKLQTNILFPVDSLIELEFTSKGLRQQISAIGKVKWVKVIIEDESYEAGVEFTSADPTDAIRKLEDYISWKLKSNKSEFIKKKISPIYAGDINILPEDETLPTLSPDQIVTVTEEIPLPHASITQTGVAEEISLPESANSNPPDVIDISLKDADDKKIEEAEAPSQAKKTQWPAIILLLLLTILLIVLLQNQFKTTPDLTEYFIDHPPTTEISTVPSPPVPSPAEEATPVVAPAETTGSTQEALPAATSDPAPAPVTKITPTPTKEAVQAIKVIGNSDSKRYHLPGMKYYDAVKAFHRVEFNSEADAIKAGYQKAPQ